MSFAPCCEQYEAKQKENKRETKRDDMEAYMVVTSKIITTPAVPAENGGQPRTSIDTICEAFLHFVCRCLGSSLLLTRRIVSIPHWAGLLAPGSKRSSSCLPIQFRTVAGSLYHERMSCSPVTVARLRRICTGFPICLIR